MRNSDLTIQTDAFNAQDIFPDLCSAGIVRFTKQGKVIVMTMWDITLKTVLTNGTVKSYNNVVPAEYKLSYGNLKFYLERSSGSHLYINVYNTGQITIQNLTGHDEGAGSIYNGELVHIQF